MLMREGLRLVIVAELDIMRIAIFEAKADAPLIVNGNRMLARSIVLERVQPIPRRDAQIGKLRCHIDRFQLS